MKRKLRWTSWIQVSMFTVLLLWNSLSPTAAQSGDTLPHSMENAIVTDFSLTQRMRTLSRSLDASHPQSEEELEHWVAQAQKVRLECLALRAEGRQLRATVLGDPNFDPEADAPLRSMTVKFFAAEDAYLDLVEEAENNTTVMVYQPESMGSDRQGLVDSLVRRGEKLLEAYDTLLASQKDLLEAAQAQGIDLEPVWDLAERESLLDSREALRALPGGRK